MVTARCSMFRAAQVRKQGGHLGAPDREFEHPVLIGCRTPCSGRIYDALPSESRTARARLLRPKLGTALGSERACVLHLAGTGDFGHERRLNLGLPLVAQVRRIGGFRFKALFPSPDKRVASACAS